MDSTGRIVLLNRSSGRAGRCDQAAGMVEPYHRIILGVNQENRWRHATSRALCLPEAMVTDRPVRARNQPLVMARVKCATSSEPDDSVQTSACLERETGAFVARPSQR